MCRLLKVYPFFSKPTASQNIVCTRFLLDPILNLGDLLCEKYDGNKEVNGLLLKELMDLNCGFKLFLKT